ncbi:hypothetical protein PRZ48_006782 [Zasmidium cellare]|uniref:Rhodopsin domain-containing protein n=1 Tax=Zasmidium cellare TaxID=395010 RepID=A0ABR0EIA7_ZASCE|nr:hypothetical protein PRZ48_006782 [Zasmidium cellare]
MTTGIGLQVRYGLGQRQSALDPTNSENMLKCFWASIWLYHLGIGFTRLSIILQVMRIFPQAAFGWVRWALCYGLLALNALTMAWATLSSVFMCDPISAFWTTDIAGSKCWARSVVWLINSTLGICLDFACAVLPLPWIKGLQLRLKQKILVMGIFVLAGLPCLLAVIRLHSLIIVADSLDPAYDNGTLATFSATEIHVAIVCACLPTLKAFLARLMPRIFGSSASRRQEWEDRYGSGSHTTFLRPRKLSDVLIWAKKHTPRPRFFFFFFRLRRRRDDDTVWESLDTQRLAWPSPARLSEGEGIQVVRVVEQDVEIAAPDAVKRKDTFEYTIEGPSEEEVSDRRCIVDGLYPRKKLWTNMAS